MIDQSRFQIAVLGSGFVGKSSFLKQYLHGTFSGDYSETVENLYFQQYMINGTMKHVNYLDTAGSMAFPSMRQLYVSKSSGFILFFSIDDAESFRNIKRIWEEIKINRHSLRSIPCIIVGNKLDKEDNREVETFEVLEWACSENLGGCFLEISSKDHTSVNNAFDMLLEQFGNTRTEQRGPFRIHTTSLNRQHDSINREKVIKKKFGKRVIYNKVIPSCKSFQESIFDDFVRHTIYMVQQQQHIRRSVTKTSSLSGIQNKHICSDTFRQKELKAKNTNYGKRNAKIEQWQKFLQAIFRRKRN
ncbi:unnamed protein product [Mytilus coruscus]|uniref:Uncharacterized protein n=1 Tax=Mytilus coruscus TaxID=42192 RepID=A0A6J8DH56_MYTCO|nr:unnamed protein product [Mytilus coruscus]